MPRARDARGPANERRERAGTYVYLKPGAVVNGTLRARQPLSVQRTSGSGGWSRIVADVGTSGWIQPQRGLPR